MNWIEWFNTPMFSELDMYIMVILIFVGIYLFNYLPRKLRGSAPTVKKEASL